MDRVKIKAVNYETGEEKECYVTQGHYALVAYKCPSLPGLTQSLCMAYAAIEPGAAKLKGAQLVDAACAFFVEWSYEEVAADDGGEDAPLGDG